ncbi:MAG: alpha/beta hydrolase [Synechococcales bacterium]|nr:alpha/beta hydrolase [Synechococcales bacterium]
MIVWIWLSITLLLCFLSLWIILPAPIFSLLPLSVGTPEVSPWLLCFSSISAVLSVYLTYFKKLPAPYWLDRWAIAFSVLSLVLSSLPLLQLPAAHQMAQTTFRRTLGEHFTQPIPVTVQQRWRSQIFHPIDAFQGIAIPKTRDRRHIPFAQYGETVLKLNLYLPAQPGSYPGIVLIYGGAWQRGKPDQVETLSRYLAAQGYAVWAIDYRHAPQSRFPTQLADIQTALRYLQAHATEGETDITRVAIVGQSAGGHLALLTAYQPTPFPLRSVTAYYSPVDLKAGYYDLPTPDPIDSRAVLTSFIGGDPVAFPHQYEQASPYHFADRPQIPTLLIYGGKDRIVESRFGRHLANQLQTHGTPTVFLEIPWADHAFDAVFNGISHQLTLYHLERFLAWSLYQ